MFYIPTDKALVAVKKEKAEKNCAECDLVFVFSSCKRLGCQSSNREDGNDVIFKLVDYKEIKNVNTENF